MFFFVILEIFEIVWIFWIFKIYELFGILGFLEILEYLDLWSLAYAVLDKNFQFTVIQSRAVFQLSRYFKLGQV